MCVIFYTVAINVGLSSQRIFAKKTARLTGRNLFASTVVQTDLRYSLTVLLNQVHGDV